MPTFYLDTRYTASYERYHHDYGYVAKGTVFREGKAVGVFEAREATAMAADLAAWVKALETYKQIMAPKVAMRRKSGRPVGKPPTKEHAKKRNQTATRLDLCPTD